MKLAESLSPITKKFVVINDTTKQLGEIVKKSDVEDGNTQTPAIENKTGMRSLRDTLTLMKKSNFFFKLEENVNGNVFWNKIRIKPTGDNRICIKDEEYDIKPNIQAYLTNTKLTTKHMDDEDKSTIYDILKNTGFHSMRQNKGLISARMKDALYNLPKAIA